MVGLAIALATPLVLQLQDSRIVEQFRTEGAILLLGIFISLPSLIYRWYWTRSTIRLAQGTSLTNIAILVRNERNKNWYDMISSRREHKNPSELAADYWIKTNYWIENPNAAEGFIEVTSPYAETLAKLEKSTNRTIIPIGAIMLMNLTYMIVESLKLLSEEHLSIIHSSLSWQNIHVPRLPYFLLVVSSFVALGYKPHGRIAKEVREHIKDLPPKIVTLLNHGDYLNVASGDSVVPQSSPNSP
ncbi:MAG: hypothetical protein KDC26_09050 [Armatimonadetes bacterium]|nr:hypothetical protein [Armatimonadota bacterium]